MSRYNPQHGANMVDRYIGSAFDIVYAVYKEMDKFPVVYEFAIEYVPKVEQILDENTEILGKLTVIDQAVLASQEAADRATEEADRIAGLDFNIRQDLKAPTGGANIVQYDENNTVYDAINRNREDFWANKETIGGIYTHYVREDDGTPVAGAECAVYVRKSGVLATGLKGKFGEPLANPFVSDSDGLVQFVADPGMYTLQVSFDLVIHTYSVYFADEQVRADLADGTTVDKGADLVAYDAGETVRDAIASSKQFDADLSNASDPALGAAIVGYSGETVKDALDRSEAFLEGNEIPLATARRFVGTAPDDAGSPDAVISVNRTHSAATSPHSFKDNTVWYPPVGDWAMASFDAYPRIYDENSTDHFIDFQSRGRKYGAGTMADYWGFAAIGRADLGHVTRATGFENRLAIYTNATCTNYTSFQSKPIIHGSAATVTHFQVRETTGIGTVGAEVGYYVKALEKAPPASTYPIYIDPQPAGVRNVIGCDTEHSGNFEITNKDKRLIIRSPDNSRWAITVDNSGVLSAVAL